MLQGTVTAKSKRDKTMTRPWSVTSIQAISEGDVKLSCWDTWPNTYTHAMPPTLFSHVLVAVSPRLCDPSTENYSKRLALHLHIHCKHIDVHLTGSFLLVKAETSKRGESVLHFV